MRESLVIYVEGLPGSGKTTLVNWIAHHYPDFFSTVPEYISPQEAQEASHKGDQAYFLKNDEAKYQLARASSKPCLVDRGHLSTVLYSKAHELVKGYPLVNVDQWYFEEVLAKGMLPDLYVHLSSAPVTTFSRRPKTTTWDNVWDYEEALHFARTGFKEYTQNHESQVPVLEFEADLLSTEEMGKTLMEYINNQMSLSNVNPLQEVAS